MTSTVSFPEVPAATGFGLALQFGSSPSPSGEIVNVVAYNYAAPNVPAPGATASPVPTGGATAKVLATWTFQLPSTAAAVTVPSPTEVFVGLPGPPPTGTNYYSYFADITAKASNGGYTPLTYANGGSASSAASGNGTTLTPGDVYALELVNF